jgi:hypothetical protein
VNIIIKESPSAVKNLKDKELFTNLIKAAALGLNKNFKNTSNRTAQATEDF